MTKQKHSPVYTEVTECQDCYKCLRNCPVKAIRVEEGRATVIPERCVACGACVSVCPNEAKRVRDDLVRAQELLASGKEVYVSLAPSWVSDFPHVSSEKMIQALKTLGFAGVSETALGAQMVSQRLAEELPTREGNLFISSACPAATAFIRKYLPEVADRITDVYSPVLAHCQLLRRSFGQEIGIVFISPCIAKKTESDAFSGLLDVALTFHDLRRWFGQARVVPERMRPSAEAVFVPERAADGAIYPVEGGMLKTVQARGGEGIRYVTVSGIPEIERCLRGVRDGELAGKVFLEVLACSGGCVQGPCMQGERPGLLKILASQDPQAIPESADLPRTGSGVPVAGRVDDQPVATDSFEEEEIREALLRVGKSKPEDELNCGGCGYDGCRAFACAMLDGRAEPCMCLSFMRKQAQKKANALLRCIPSGVVISDANIHIVECNKAFADLVGEEAQILWEANPGMEGANLRKLLPFASLLQEVLNSGQDLHREMMRAFGKILDVRVFLIEPGQTAGMLLSDVTDPGQRREQIACRARLVIKKNLQTVQSIAAELGENMAETEILLRSLAEDYGDPTLQPPSASDPSTPENPSAPS